MKKIHLVKKPFLFFLGESLNEWIFMRRKFLKVILMHSFAVVRKSWAFRTTIKKLLHHQPTFLLWHFLKQSNTFLDYSILLKLKCHRKVMKKLVYYLLKTYFVGLRYFYCSSWKTMMCYNKKLVELHFNWRKGL